MFKKNFSSILYRSMGALLLLISLPDAARAAGESKGLQLATSNDLTKLIIHIVQFMSAGVGVVLVIMMGMAGFKYLTAGDNPNQISAAKKQIADVILSIFLYVFGLAILNWLTPGGILQ